MSPANIYFGVEGQGHEPQKQCRRGSLHPRNFEFGVLSCSEWIVYLSICTRFLICNP